MNTNSLKYIVEMKNLKLIHFAHLYQTKKNNQKPKYTKGNIALSPQTLN